MKTIIFVFACVLGLYSFVLADEHFVIADKLSIADVEAFADKASGKYPKFKVLGVHQEGNSAEIYYQYRKKGFGPHEDEIEVVRFNSGKWYSPEENEFLHKK